MPVFDIKMMHKSLGTKRFQSEAIGDIHEDSSDEIQGDLNESVDMFNDEGGANSRLASPGMDTDNNNRDKTVTTAKGKEFCEVPEQLKDYLGIDAVIVPIKGDGSCLYGSASAHIYQDQKHANELRRSCHKFMIDNWAYYCGFFPTPFTETVGAKCLHYEFLYSSSM